MNLLTVLLVLLSNIYSLNPYVYIDTEYFVEHNFWEPIEKSPDLNKKNLCSVRIKFEERDEHLCTIELPNDSDYRYETNNSYYSNINRSDVRNIISYLKSQRKDKAYLRFEFYYTDKSHEYARKAFLDHRNLEWYKTFKVVELKTENTIEFSNDEPRNVVMHHVEERFRNLILNDLIIFNNKILKEWNGEFEEKPNFDLYYFKNYSDCFKELKGFIDSLKFLVLFDDTSNSATFTTSNQETNTITYSSVIENLTEKFGKDFENMNTDEKRILKSVFDSICKSVTNELLNDKIVLPLGKSYTIDYHFEKLYAFIIKKTCETQEICICPDRYKSKRAFCHHYPNDAHEKMNLKKILLFDLYETISKYFFNLTSEDYVEFEKVVCDFYNMIKYLKNKFRDECLQLDIQCLRKNKAYSKPIVINDYKCRIVKGIELYFPKNSETGKLKAFDSEGKEIEIKKGVDYFKTSKSTIFITFENILSKKIKEIEVFSENNEFSKRFWILEDLRIKEDESDIN
ncbi:hypothetical protein NBO_501g0009 [Nosema bombycis CQ1]|uniref:Uncharacterized protein n=1 Tax=Nosema bombycis (strain CQ1 / CVCC 102059) TaxID=578461 RepID=R0KPU6_NOSB1|nr:hypothetical protein NBO_501g0009 [Nosema bombycis CQ1]|eukprot:EOB12217.1 hypothetical protein NBO_501g0009 [Nosema bombycis CQ1]